MSRAAPCGVVLEAGLLASRLAQVFENTERQTIEAHYIFPMDAGAAVNGLEIKVDGRVIKGVVQEKEEAKRTCVVARAPVLAAAVAMRGWRGRRRVWVSVVAEPAARGSEVFRSPTPLHGVTNTRYDTAKAMGHGAYLVQESAISTDVFKTSLGNLRHGTMVRCSRRPPPTRMWVVALTACSCCCARAGSG